jgi:carbamoyltransferase
LEEAVGDWFEDEGAVPFMTQVFQIREDKRSRIPAVTHVDGSGRLQSVSKKTNGPFYALIEAFDELTDVPMVLNTSFNGMNPSSANPGKHLTASCGPKWTFWCWVTASSFANKRRGLQLVGTSILGLPPD